MIKQSLKFVAAFPTTTDAMHMQIAADKADLSGRLIPVPGGIRAGCGLAWCSEAELEEAVRQVIMENKISVDAFCQMMW